MAEHFWKEIPLNGKLVTGDDPTTIDTNFQSLKNMRYEDKTVVGIGGMSKINTTQVTDNPHFQNAFHFRKEQPAESHVLVQAVTSGDASPKIVQIDHTSSDVPNQVDFTGGATPTALYTEDTSASIARFDKAPNGQVVICNSKEALIWGGDESRVSRFVNAQNGTETNLKDFTSETRNSLDTTGNTAVLDEFGQATTLWYVGYVRPLNGAKFYIKTGTENTTAATLIVKYWDGSAWANTTETDGTFTATETMSQTGSVTWTDSTDLHKQVWKFDDYLYWYQFTTSAAIDATTEVYRATGLSPMQKIKNVWDGAFRNITNAKYWDNDVATFYNITPKVFSANYANGNPNTFMQFTGTSNETTDYMVCGFSEKQVAVKMKFGDENVNDAASGTLTVSYWNGIAWSALTIVDGTNDGTRTFAKNGVVSWNKPTGEFQVQPYQGSVTSTDTPAFYYYKFTWSVILGSTCYLDQVTGIPSFDPMNQYKFPLFSKNRTMLCSRQDCAKNSVLISAVDQPDVYNGCDSALLLFGGEEEIVSGVSLYSRLSSNIYDITLFFKQHSIYGLTGFSPADFQPYTISETIGCIAPLTVKVDIIEVQQKITRPVILWQAEDGIYMFDNTSPRRLSDDIDNFFDKNEAAANRLHPSYVDRSISFIDTEFHEYHWLFADGTSSGTLNREFVYDMRRQKWYEADRHEVLAYTSGGTTEITAGDTITGATSSSTAVVRSVTLSSGTWAGGDAAGNLIISVKSAAFQAENLNVGVATNLATIGADSVPNLLQCGIQVEDTTGNKYNYGLLDAGYVERLENTASMDGTAYAQSFRLGDIAPVDGSITNLSQIIKHQVYMKDTGTDATVAVTHYGDGKTAGTSIASAEDPTKSGYRFARTSETVNKSIDGNVFHSTEYSMTSSDIIHAFHPLFISWRVNPIGEVKE